MKEYLDLLKHVHSKGIEKSDRTGTGTVSVFGVQRKYDLREGFPLVTTKKTLFNAIVHELLWFLKGSTNINDGLKEHIERLREIWTIPKQKTSCPSCNHEQETKLDLDNSNFFAKS